jgi:hypothetical protein
MCFSSHRGRARAPEVPEHRSGRRCLLKAEDTNHATSAVVKRESVVSKGLDPRPRGLQPSLPTRVAAAPCDGPPITYHRNGDSAVLIAQSPLKTHGLCTPRRGMPARPPAGSTSRVTAGRAGPVHDAGRPHGGDSRRRGRPTQAPAVSASQGRRAAGRSRGAGSRAGPGEPGRGKACGAGGGNGVQRLVDPSARGPDRCPRPTTAPAAGCARPGNAGSLASPAPTP